ncbi:MAG: DUF951 domain-containing protein [Clostridiales bacterium]|nr:DUF951 domain-containing protein [Clostridiales bacterium]
MNSLPVFNIGDVLQMKKAHPCGSVNWKILAAGYDIRVKCLGCGRVVLFPRIEFEKLVKKSHKGKTES